MRPISKQKKTRILQRLFSGETYGDVSVKADCSKSTVKKIFDEFVDFSSSSSLEEAAENYGISEEILVLRDIACDAKKTGSSFPDLLQSARLLLLLRKLGMNPTQLEDTISVLDRHRQKFGDYVQSALKLASLENETGKSYGELIVDYERAKKEIATLLVEIKKTEFTLSQEQKDADAKIRSLTQQIQIRGFALVELERRTNTAKSVLVEFEKKKQELHDYEIGFDDFSTVKNFLSTIQNLRGNAVRAVQIIKECGSLEEKLSQLKNEIISTETLHIEQKKSRGKEIEQLETKKRTLETELSEKEGTVKRIQNTIEALRKELESLKQTREATRLQVDALQKRQAEMLDVIPDIDVIQSAIPARRQELKDLEEKITDKKNVLSVAVALESLLTKTPPDRKTLIHWLEFGGISTSFQPTDEMARKAITDLLAKEGYVPETDLKLPLATMQHNLEEQQDLTKLWMKRAEKKSKKLIECEEWLKKAHAAVDRQRSEELWKHIGSFLADLSLELRAESK